MASKVDWDQFPDADSGTRPSGKDDWDQFPDAGDSPGIISQAGGAILGGVAKVGRAIDTYTGAPTRAAIAAAQTAPSPSEILPNAVNAFSNQFGNDPSKAPTGQDIVENAGVPKASAASKVLGFGMDAAANPLNFVPVGEIVGGTAKALGGVVGLGGDAADAAAPVSDAVVPASATPVRSAVVSPGIASRMAGKAAEAMTGVNARMESNYLSNTDRINQIISDYKGPEGYQSAEHAADIRNQWNANIQSAKQQLNSQIDSALAKSPKSAGIPLKPILDKLDAAKAGLNPNLSADQAAISQINGLRSEVIQGALPGQSELATNPQTLNRLKQIFQDKARPSYAPDGTIFQQSTAVANAAKGVAASMRSALNDAVPSVAEANNGLSQLHDIEDSMNSSLLKPEGNPAALTRAGIDPNGTDARAIQKLGQITGHNFQQDATDFATARTFADPKWTPDFTGKSIFRVGLGAIPGVIAYKMGVPAEVAAAMALGSTSPAALKAGTNVLNLVGKTAALPVDATSAAANAGYRALISPAGQSAVGIGARALPAFSISQGQGANAPLGPDLWARQGIQKLGLDNKTAQRVASDPKGKQLHIQA